MPVPKVDLSLTAIAKALLKEGCYPRQIAELTGLNQDYVRKIRQRQAGGDKAWGRWREANKDQLRRKDRERKRSRANEARGDVRSTI